MDKKIISIYMGNPDNSNHAELELPATPWELVDAMDRLRLSEGQEPYWQVEDMGRYEFLAPHLDGYDLYQFNALAEKLRTFGDVDAVAFEGLVQMELNNLYQNNGGELTLRRVLDLAYSVDCCHVVPGITDDAALGQFYVENDFLPALATVPDSVLEMLERKVEALNNKMLALVNESVSSGDGIEAHESEFMTLSQETELLKQRIAAIQESTAKDNGEQSRLEQIQAIISERESKCMKYDDSIVRQMVECIKVYPGGKLEIIFGGGYLVEESV